MFGKGIGPEEFGLVRTIFVGVQNPFQGNSIHPFGFCQILAKALFTFFFGMFGSKIGLRNIVEVVLGAIQK